jgi:type II secretory ATPase GspE/PulE/Tfp pilus assembly ATPase PilB-like protein
VAVKASLTGHLVLSTLHTNSAAGVVTRLIDMGAERYLLAATLRLCVAQRLVRRLCQHPGCKRPRPLTQAQADLLGPPAMAGMTIYDPGGCVYCDSRGYSGRLGLFELMPVDAELAELITDGAKEDELDRTRVARGHPSLRQDAAAKVLDGRISFADAVEAVDMT